MQTVSNRYTHFLKKTTDMNKVDEEKMWQNLAEVQEQYSEWKEPIEFFKNAIEREKWHNLAETHEKNEEWKEAIECYKKSIACRKLYDDGFKEELSIIDIYENKLHDYKMAEVWRMSMPDESELDTDMLLRRGLWRKAFLQNRNHLEKCLDKMNDYLIKDYDGYAKPFDMDADNCLYERFVCDSAEYLSSINDILKTFGKAIFSEIDGCAANYSIYLEQIRDTVNTILEEEDVYVLESKVSDDVEVWPPKPDDYPNDEMEWHRELEMRADKAKQFVL